MLPVFPGPASNQPSQTDPQSFYASSFSSCLPQHHHPSAYTQQVQIPDAATPLCQPVIGCPEVSLDSAHICCAVHMGFPKPEKRNNHNSITISLYACQAGIQPSTFKGSPIGHGSISLFRSSPLKPGPRAVLRAGVFNKGRVGTQTNF